jgi:hypothetical protein
MTHTDLSGDAVESTQTDDGLAVKRRRHQSLVGDQH